VLITHLSEVFKRKAPDLLTRAETERMLDHVRSTHRSLVDELVPTVLSVSEVQRVLQQLLREQVSLRGLDIILEVLIDAGKVSRVIDDLVERVRERIGATICQRLLDNQGELHVMTLAPELERALASGGRAALATDVGQMDAFLTNLAKLADTMAAQGRSPVLLCPAPLRRALRQLLQRALPYIVVLSVAEVPASTMVRSTGSVSATAVATAATPA
jgi:flagellar biosynthesis protein FlhA